MTLVDFSQWWNGDERDQASSREEVLYQAEALRFLEDSPKVVDLGCGSGALVRKLVAAGHDAYGLTYQRAEVEKAASDRIFLGDIHATPWLNETFDAFVMWDVLEHTLSPFIALAEARRITKRGGRGLIFIPGVSWTETRYHVVVPTIRQMRHLLDLTGWDLETLDDLSDARSNRKDDEGMAIYYVKRRA